MTAAGSAWPRLAFITWPTRNPNHRGFAAAVLLDLFGIRGDDFVDDLAQRALIADDCSPSRSMMASGASPVANIFGKISLASLPLILPCAIMATSLPRFSALTGDSANFLLAFSRPARSPITQFAAARGSPATAATFSK